MQQDCSTHSGAKQGSKETPAEHEVYLPALPASLPGRLVETPAFSSASLAKPVMASSCCAAVERLDVLLKLRERRGSCNRV